MTRSIRRWWKRHNPFAVWHEHTGIADAIPGARPRVLMHRHPVYLGHAEDLAIAHPDVL